jgi:proteasome alpha subunit
VKPLEVEILVAELGGRVEDSQLFHILYDGTVVDEQHFAVLGGDADAINERFAPAFDASWSLQQALRACVGALGEPGTTLGHEVLEVAVLEDRGERRTFHRVNGAELRSLVEGASPQ